MWLKGIRGQLYAVQLVSILLFVCISVWGLGEVQRYSAARSALYTDSAFHQVVHSVDSVIESVAITAKSFAYTEPAQRLLLGEGDRDTQIQEYASAADTVRFIVSTNSNIIDVALLSVQGKDYLFGLQLNHRSNSTAIEYAQACVDAQKKSGVFIDFPKEDGSSEFATFAYVLPVYSSLQGERSGQYIGACVMLCRFSNIIESMTAATMEGGVLELLGRDGTRLFVTGEADVQTSIPSSWNSHVFTSTGWTYQQSVYTEGLRLFQGTMQSLFFPLLFAAALVMILLMVLIQRNISSPILQLSEQLIEIARQPLANPEKRVQVSTSNELSRIADNINTMLEHIHHANEERIRSQRHLLEVELSKNRMQLSALQSQINPHFLYNNLACMRGLALEHNLPVIASIASNMAAMFRYSIKGANFVQFRDELSIAQKYLDTMNLRMDNKFHFHVDVPSSLLECWMVKMTLQPLVENAVFHGLESLQGSGEISISACFVSNGVYCVRIHDNGVGMEPKMVSRLNEELARSIDTTEQSEHDGIGIHNINKKIRLLLGASYGLKIESQPMKGSTITVTMPYLATKPVDG